MIVSLFRNKETRKEVTGERKKVGFNRAERRLNAIIAIL